MNKWVQTGRFSELGSKVFKKHKQKGDRSDTVC